MDNGDLLTARKPESGDNIHKGHRERLKERFCKENGLDSFEDHNILEMLLFYAVPRRDTNPLAHQLIERFGSLSAVLDASTEDLCQVPGIGKNAAILLKLTPHIARRYYISQQKPKTVLDSTEKAGAFLIPYFLSSRTEKIYIVFLDARNQVIDCKLVAEGSVDTAKIPVRKVVERALTVNASAIIVSHNHLSGIALPSQADQLATIKLKSALDAMQIKLFDHIIVAGDDFVSFAHSGLL